MLTVRRSLAAACAGAALALAAAGPASAAASRFGRSPALDNPAIQAGNAAAYSTGRVVVKFRDPVQSGGAGKASGNAAIDAVLQRHAVSAFEPVSRKAQAASKPGLVDLSRVYEIRYDDGSDAMQVARELAAHPEIEYAEPLFVHETDLIPNDSFWVNQSFYLNTRMKFALAWDITTGGTGNAVVAICDGGTDWDHVDLAANVWSNVDEIAGNLMDDDSNGFVDDVRGWNFANNTNDPTGLPGTPLNANHGTHTAGIACAVANNAAGIAGATFNSKFMPICVSSPTTDNSLAFGYAGILYAADNDADVVNCSWGRGGTASAFEQDVIDYAYDNGTAVVCAAGNTGAEQEHWPGAYNHVLSVAWLNNTDVRNGSSTFGLWVDVSAQGTSILSTLNSPANGYGSMSGTSMAAPHAAGLCGLVKTRFPGYTPEQVMQRVRVTCDPIDAANPSIAGKLGYGRLNAQRALNKNTPAISVTSNTFTTTDGDNIIEPSETVTLNLEVTNWLAACTGLEFRLRDNSTNITEVDSIVAVASLDSLESLTLPPFTYTVSPTAPIQHTVVFTVTISAMSPAYNDKNRFEMTVLQVFATHDRNNIDCSVTSVGKLGYALAAGGTGKDGIGLRFNGSSSYLFEGGLMIGNGPTAVSNGCRVGDTSQDDDFRTEPNGVPLVTEPSPPFDEYGIATFTDAIADSPLGLWLRQESIEMGDPPNDDFIVLRYLVRNIGAVARNGLHMGWYCDMDIDGSSFATNVTGYDATRGLMYARDTSPAGPDDYVGVVTLSSQGTTSARGIWNNQAESPDWGVYDGYTDTEKWETISSAGPVHTTVGPSDVSIGIGTGPFDLAPGDSTVIGFAFVGGTNLADLQANSDAAQAYYDGLTTAIGDDDGISLTPRALRLAQNTPNPFNPSTRIAFDMPRAAHVSLRVYTVDGRLVRTLLDGVRPAGADQAIVWDGRDDGGHQQPSGTYLYRFAVEGGAPLVRKMQLLK